VKILIIGILTSVIIPNGVASIGLMAFQGNQLTSVTPGANVKFDNSTFSDSKNKSIGFWEAYNAASKAAGTYVRPNTGSTKWTRQ
jgi:hypothetical protein